MLTVRVIRQCGGKPVDSTHACHSVRREGDEVQVVFDEAGASQVFDEGEFYVMNGQGKTVATYRLPKRAQSEARS
jgi:hypothetical protein